MAKAFYLQEFMQKKWCLNCGGTDVYYKNHHDVEATCVTPELRVVVYGCHGCGNNFEVKIPQLKKVEIAPY